MSPSGGVPPCARSRSPTGRRVTILGYGCANTRIPKKKPDWAPAWLAAFEHAGMVSAVCQVAGVGRMTVYTRYHGEPDFAAAWDAIEARATDDLEAEAMRRALDGSDSLLIFLLKSRKPAVYGERGGSSSPARRADRSPRQQCRSTYRTPRRAISLISCSSAWPATHTSSPGASRSMTCSEDRNAGGSSRVSEGLSGDSEPLAAVTGDGTGSAGGQGEIRHWEARRVELFNERYGADLSGADARKIVTDVRDAVRDANPELADQARANSRNDLVVERDNVLLGAALPLVSTVNGKQNCSRPSSDDDDFRKRAGSLIFGSILRRLR